MTLVEYFVALLSTPFHQAVVVDPKTHDWSTTPDNSVVGVVVVADYDLPDSFVQEVFRVLFPHAMFVVIPDGDNQNHYETTCRVEDHGFVVRDSVLFLETQEDVKRTYDVPRPSRVEKTSGCENLPVLSKFEIHGVEEGNTRALNPAAVVATDSSNTHPTIKPVGLMAVLIDNERGTVLDPFMGSGTTGVACAQLGAGFVGTEMDEDYYQIAAHRVDYAVRSSFHNLETEMDPYDKPEPKKPDGFLEFFAG